VVPDGIRLIHLPHYTPELQPAECLWELLDEPIVDRHFDTLGELQSVIETRCVGLAQNLNQPEPSPASIGGQKSQSRINQHELVSQISIVTRDRGGGYAIAVQRALPHAIQVADRWHLMENASHAFRDAVRKCMRQIRTTITAAKVDPALLTFAEKLQYEGYLRREETNASILALSEQKVPIKEIVRRTGYSRGLIRKILRGQRSDIFRTKCSSLEPYLPWLDSQWAAGCRNGAALWRALRQQGFRGCLGVVSEWKARRKRAERTGSAELTRAPSARTIARLLTAGRDRLSKAETMTVAAIESGVTVFVEARGIIAEFLGIIRRKALADLQE
jgi:transposase